MTTTARERYESIVAEFDRATSDIFEDDEKFSVVMEIPLEAPAEWFMDYKVRDAVMTYAMNDPKFAFILCHKLSNAPRKVFMDKGEFSQAHLELLATAIQVGAMYEQEQSADLIEVAEHIAEKFDLELPSLVGLSKRILGAGWDFEHMREQTHRDLMPKVLASLDEE